MAISKAPATSEVVVSPIQTKTIRLSILGTRPLIVSRMAEKARRELLLPSGRRTMADRAQSLKHDPLAEFRASPYTLPRDDEPTYLAALAAWFKGSMMTAALELPGTKKTQIGRLVWVEGERLPLYGAPELLMSVVRSADMNKTPDIRSRCIVPAWAVEIDITFVVPMLTERSIINLIAAAGMVSGVGDWRNEKGKGTYGQFIVTDPDDERFAEIVATGGREVQRAAMETPAFYDEESEELYQWFEATVSERGRKGQLTSLSAAAD
jgi:hypothetical protein